MKKVAKKASVLLFALMLVVCMALPVSAASISKKKVTICTGQTIQLKVNGVKKKARWTSSNKSVATVTQKGKVSAKKKGTTTVTAKIGKKKYTCKVTVESPKLSKTSITVKKGKAYQLKMRNTKQKYKWSSKNKSIATVTSKGKVTGKKTGTTYIYAKSASGKIFKCKVIVKKSASSGGSFSDGSGSNGSNPSIISKPTIKTYGLGQTWRVNGQFEFTINRVYETDYRNPYDETNPAQVIMIEYTCKNIGYTNNDSFMPGLWMTIDNYGKVIDQSGYMAEIYPGDINHYYQELPIGASCVAESCYGLRNRSQRIKLQMDMYLGGMRTEQALFDLPVY